MMLLTAKAKPNRGLSEEMNLGNRMSGINLGSTGRSEKGVCYVLKQAQK